MGQLRPFDAQIGFDLFLSDSEDLSESDSLCSSLMDYYASSGQTVCDEEMNVTESNVINNGINSYQSPPQSKIIKSIKVCPGAPMMKRAKTKRCREYIETKFSNLRRI